MKLKGKKLERIINKINKIENKTNSKFKAVKRNVSFLERNIYFKETNIPDDKTYAIIRDEKGNVHNIKLGEE